MKCVKSSNLINRALAFHPCEPIITQNVCKLYLKPIESKQSNSYIHKWTQYLEGLIKNWYHHCFTSAFYFIYSEAMERKLTKKTVSLCIPNPPRSLSRKKWKSTPSFIFAFLFSLTSSLSHNLKLGNMEEATIDIWAFLETPSMIWCSIF